MGLDASSKLTSPTTAQFTANHSNGTPRLESGIIFLSGHGNSSVMGFQTVGVRNSTTDSGIYIGIGKYNNFRTALAVFAGCETAAGSENITKYIVDRGAKISIGWTTSVSAGSHTNWLKRFNDKIKDKSTTVAGAASSASFAIYLDGRVRNYKIYGYSNYNPWYFMSGGESASAIALEANEYVVKEADVTMKENIITDENAKLISEEFIKSKISKDFNSDDYKVEINGVEEKYIDYILYVNGVRTNAGYTVVVDKNGEVRLHDNTNVGVRKIKSNINSISSKATSSIAKTTLNNAMTKAKLKYKDSSFKVELETPYYDVETNTLYQAVLIQVKSSDGLLYVMEHLEEIR